MISDSLLETLASLRTFDKKVFVAENFLTAAFAYLLKCDKPLLKYYLNYLGYHCSVLPEVQTQKTHGIASGNIPDIVFSDRHTYIVQENKINAPIGRKNQLKRYAKQIKDSKKRIKGLVYVRRRHKPNHSIPHSIAGIRVRRLTWDEIGSLLKKSSGEMNGKPVWLRDEFYRFLEAHQMTFPKPLNIPKLRMAWKSYEPQKKILKRMVQESCDALQRTLGNSPCVARIPHSAAAEEYPGFYIYYTKGRRLKKVMGNVDLWVWCGVSLP